MKFRIYLIFFLLSSNVSGKEISYSYLFDCTDEAWEKSYEYYSEILWRSDIEDHFKIKDISTDKNVKSKALAEATIWSNENGFLPCGIRMCGMVGYSKVGNIVVKIQSYDISSWHSPEALLALTRSGNKSSVFHSGCSKYN